MTSQVQINIGANATQAMGVLGRLKAQMGGLQGSFARGFPLLGRLGGAGIMGGVAGIAGMAAFAGFGAIMKSVREGFSEMAESNHAYAMAVQALTGQFKDVGRNSARTLIPLWSEVQWLWTIVSRGNKAAREEMLAQGFGQKRVGRGLLEERMEARYAKYGPGPITALEQETFDADLAKERKRVGWKDPKKKKWESFFEMPEQTNAAAFTTRGFLTQSEATGFSGSMSFQQEVTGYLSVIAANSEMFIQAKDINNA